MRKLTLLIVLLTYCFILNAQNVVVTDDEGYTAHSSAMLDIKSSTKGLLIPRITTSERTTLASTAAKGLLVFDTNESVFYYYDGSAWVNISKGQIWTVNSNYVLLSDIDSRVGIGTETPNSKLEVQADASFTDTDTLFVVKDKNGKPVFAVFPDGAKVIVDITAKGKLGGFAVSGRTPSKGLEEDIMLITTDSTRIYVNDTLNSKGKLGGFAVSGRTPSKGFGNDYLVITPDSTRIYVNDTIQGKGKIGGFAVSGRTPSKGATGNYIEVTRDSTRIYVAEDAKGKLGGFAVSGRTPSKGGFNDYFNVSGSAAADVVANESRVMWYPKKAAFLAGEVHVGSADSVGTNSTAVGYRNVAMGDYSQAMGYQAKALYLNSTAFGFNALANDTNAFAFGNYAEANGKNSFAFGDSAIVTAEDAYAIGAYAYTSGRGSFAIGSKDRYFSDNFELRTTAIGELSMAIGLDADAEGFQSVAVGNEVHATGDWSVAIGRSSRANEDFACAIYGGIASGFGSLAIGGQSLGHNSITIGMSESSGSSSVAIGNNANASGDNSNAFGYGSEATGEYTTAFGYETVAQGAFSFVLGYYNKLEGNTTTYGDTDPLFVIGNGKSWQRANAFNLLHNGQTAIGNITPSARLHVSANTGEIPFKVDVNNTLKFQVSSNGGASIGYADTPPSDGLIVSGNVGIGTSLPEAPLDIKTNSSGYALHLEENGAETEAWKIGVNSSGSLIFYDETTARIVFEDGTNDVGIGLTNPSYNLDVATSIGVNGNEAIYHNTTSDYFRWGYSGAYNYFPDEVGIGIATPSYNLDVSTSIGINGNEAIYHNSTSDYFRWGYEGAYNYFPDEVGIGTSTIGSHKLLVISEAPDIGASGSTMHIENTNGGGVAAHILNSSDDSEDLAFLVSNKGTGDIVGFDSWHGNGSWDREFKVDYVGNAYCDGAWHTAAADFAELFKTIEDVDFYEPGEIMMIGEASYTAHRCNDENKSHILGVYSEKPGIIGNSSMEEEDNEGKIPVGLLGVIDTKVCAENGDVEIGDFITISSTPGVGMKATQSAMVVGRALESLVNSDDGKIKVFVNVHWVEINSGKEISELKKENQELKQQINKILELLEKEN